MHVLHIIDTLGLGGAERMLVDLANATVSDGHQVSVCVTRSETTLAPELDRKIALLVLDRRRRFSPSASLRLAAWVRKQGIDVVHVHMRHTLAFVLSLRVIGALRIPIVFHDHYGTIEVDTTVPLWFRLGHRLVDHYVGVYERLSEWATDAGIPRERTTTIGNVLDLRRLGSAQNSKLREELGAPNSVPLGVIVATLRRDKGIEVLIDAVARSRHRDHVRIAIVGATGDAAYATSLRTSVSRHGLDSVVTFVGARTDVPELLAGADFAVLSSHTESGPLVLIEYLAARLPLVSTLVGDIGRRLAALGVPGFVAPGDPPAFANALDALLDLPISERCDRGEIGRRALVNGWDIRAVMPRWYRVYRMAIERRSV
jgi:glycosyltransferase involved in cell wall biosynthesis